MVTKLLRLIFVLYGAVVLTVLSLQIHHPMGEAARGADCLPECMDPTEQWGFPLLYIQETFVTSVGRTFHFWPFLGNVVFYAALLGWFLRGLSLPRLNADLLVKAALWPLMWFLLLQWNKGWPMLGVIAAGGLWHILRAPSRLAPAWWLSVGLTGAGGFLLGRTWLLEPHLQMLMVWSAVFWGGLNVPAHLNWRTLVVHLGLTLLTGLWWSTLIEGPLLAALVTGLTGSSMMHGVSGMWLSMYMAPQLLLSCLERWRGLSFLKDKQLDPAT